MTGWLVKLGQVVTTQLVQFGQIAVLGFDIVKTACTGRPRWQETSDQVFKIGWQSQAVVLITGAFTGMVFAEIGRAHV